MIFKIEVLAILNAGNRLKRNITSKAIVSQTAISAIVKLETRGLVIKINKVMMTPREIPVAKLEESTIAL